MSLGSCTKCGGTLCVSTGPVTKEHPDGRREVSRQTQVLCEQCGQLHPDHPIFKEIAAAEAAAANRPAPRDPGRADYAPGYSVSILTLERKAADADKRADAAEKRADELDRRLTALEDVVAELNEKAAHGKRR
jgi:hypothetical protein